MNESPEGTLAWQEGGPQTAHHLKGDEGEGAEDAHKRKRKKGQRNEDGQRFVVPTTTAKR